MKFAAGVLTTPHKTLRLVPLVTKYLVNCVSAMMVLSPGCATTAEKFASKDGIAVYQERQRWLMRRNNHEKDYFTCILYMHMGSV